MKFNYKIFASPSDLTDFVNKYGIPQKNIQDIVFTSHSCNYTLFYWETIVYNSPDIP